MGPDDLSPELEPVKARTMTREATAEVLPVIVSSKAARSHLIRFNAHNSGSGDRAFEPRSPPHLKAMPLIKKPEFCYMQSNVLSALIRDRCDRV